MLFNKCNVKVNKSTRLDNAVKSYNICGLTEASTNYKFII